MTWQWVDVTKMRDLQNKTEQTNRNFENSFKSKIENSKIESQKQLREKIETSKRT